MCSAELEDGAHLTFENLLAITMYIHIPILYGISKHVIRTRSFKKSFVTEVAPVVLSTV